MTLSELFSVYLYNTTENLSIVLYESESIVLGESIDIICPKYRGHSLQMKYGYGMVDNGKNIILKNHC